MTPALYIAWDGADNNSIHLGGAVAPRTCLHRPSCLLGAVVGGLPRGGLELATKNRETAWVGVVRRPLGISSECKFQLDLAKYRQCLANGASGPSRWPSPYLVRRALREGSSLHRFANSRLQRAVAAHWSRLRHVT